MQSSYSSPVYKGGKQHTFEDDYSMGATVDQCDAQVQLGFLRKARPLPYQSKLASLELNSSRMQRIAWLKRGIQLRC